MVRSLRAPHARNGNDMPTERETAHLDALPREHPTPIVHAEIRTGSGGGLLLGFGAALLLAAGAMALVPRVMPGQAGLVQSLADLGVTSFPLFAAGILFTGLWLAVRTSREHSIAAQHAAMSAAPAIGALSERIVDLRDGFQGLRLEFVYVKDLVKTQIERQNEAANRDPSAEGMYRLAASLDQLGQRIERQVGAGQNEIREKLESLWSAIEISRQESRDGRIHLGDDDGPHEPHEPHEHHEHDETREDEPKVHHAEIVEHPLDHGDAHPEMSHDDAASRERLGILDLLDDLGRLLPKKSTAVVPARPLITSDAFEGVQDEGWERHQALAGPLPSIRIENPSEKSRVGGLLGSPDVHEPSDDLAIVRKLEELRSLLSDSRVRDALTSMDKIAD